MTHHRMIAPARTERHRVATSDHPAVGPRRGSRPGRVESSRPGTRGSHLRVLALPDGEDGFTLVELLVVVLMLVALVGIAVPTFVGQREGAERAAMQSELRTAAIALESYRARNGVYAAQALTTRDFGFVPSIDVATFFVPPAGGASADQYCVLAWFDPLDDPGDTRGTIDASDAGQAAQWSISERGMAFVGDAATPRTCP